MEDNKLEETDQTSKDSQSNTPEKSNWWSDKKLTKENKPTFFGHIVLSIFLIISISIGYFILNGYAYCISKKWFDSQVTSLSSKNSNKSIFNYQVNTNEAQKNRLMNQLDQAEQGLQTHRTIALYMYRQNYTSLSMAIVLGGLSAVCLVFISKNGWDKTNNALMNIFIVFALGTLFYADITNIFKHEENIENNWLLYAQYDDLKNQILSYAVTKTDRKGQTMKIEEFIGSVDDRLKLLNQKPLIFDSKPIFERYVDPIDKNIKKE